jgi:LacI family transcriptional regulator
MVYPALTTMDQSILGKGQLAGRLISAILGKTDAPRESFIDVAIVERDSVATRSPS